MKRYDCFLFFNELDVLEIRLRELCGVVDEFVIGESPVTHKGDPKPLYFHENRQRFAEWKNQIRHVVIDDLPSNPSPDVEGDPNDGCWMRVRAQRERLMKAIPLNDHDTVVLSDCDEIVRREVFEQFDARSTLVAGLHLPDYTYFLNVRLAGSDHSDANIMNGHYAFRADHLGLRGDNGQQTRNTIPNAGWHFSYMGGGNVSSQKAASSAHWNAPGSAAMSAALKDGTQFQREGGIGGDRLRKVKIDHTFPHWVRMNQSALYKRGLIHAPAFRSQQGEDEWCFENLKLPSAGVYVDIGAFHPEDGSNTAFLRDAGWRGVVIDANPNNAKDWTDPDLTVAVLSDKPNARFEFNEGNPSNSRIGDSGDVKDCRLLEDILAEKSVGQIDFLSIDIEGHEFNVMKGFNFSKHKPKVIVAEYNTFGIGEDLRLRDLLISKGYKVVHQNPSNFIFTK